MTSRRADEAGVPGRTRCGFTWNGLLWSLIHPRRPNRIVPTIPGVVLVALSFGIGMAAYNASSNILFLTLSLLLASLILSGVLSWLNVRRVRWTLQVPPAMRAGHETMAGIELANRKRLLPTHGLAFRLRARPAPREGVYRAESTFMAKGPEIRAALAEAEAAEIHGTVTLSSRLDPRDATRLDWVFRPTRRGRLRIELASVTSAFPFGFLRKEIGTGICGEAVVWPATLAYRQQARIAVARQSGEERVARAGFGSDLLAVRRYSAGDSHRLIHWKASARTRQLLIRQFAAEVTQGYILWLRSDREQWPRAGQFETAVSFAATLAEDLYRAGRLDAFAIDGRPAISVRRLHDLETVLSALAVLEHAAEPAAANPRSGRRGNLLVFAAEGPRGVGAYVDGQLTASA